MTTAFDPVAFKSTTRAQWEAAAEAWHRWGPAIEDWLGDATELMLDDVPPRQDGSRVLDVAAGAGGQTLAAARRVGPTGHVLATDISPAHPRVRRRERRRGRARQRRDARGRRRGPVGGAGRRRTTRRSPGSA